MPKIAKNTIRTNYGNTYYWEFTWALGKDDFYVDIQNKIKEINDKIKSSSSQNKKGIFFI